VIDVHVLTHSGTNPEWLAQCLRSLEGEPVVVHVVEGVEGSVGAGRAKGFQLGTCEFVAYVDSDDYVVPGGYAKSLAAMANHRCVVPREYVEYTDGRRHKYTKSGHNGVVYRREDILPLLPAFQSEPQVYQTYRSYLGVPTNGFRLGTYPTRVGNNAMYDTRTLLFSGFDRVQFATGVRFLTGDVLTGAVSYDVLPPLNAQYSSYIFTPKVSQYQQVLYSDEDRTEEAIGFGGSVSFSHWTGTETSPRGYVFRNGDVGWEEIPGIAASNEVHYVGNGHFGQCGRLFKEEGF